MSEVFWSPITAIHSNLPPGTLVVGVPGSGKSYTLLNIAANTLEQGCRLFALDAKNDLLPLKRLFPDVKITDVNNIQSGSLDPFLVFKDIDTTIVLTIVEMMCGSITREQRNVITPIIGDFIKRLNIDRSSASFRSFAEYLYEHENVEAQTVGNELLLNATSKYGPLIFGAPGVASRALKIDSKQSRVISILGMALPSGSSIPKSDELLNSAVVYIICRMIKNLLTDKTVNGKLVDRVPTLFMLDEVHMLMRSNAISDIIDEFLVLGRSLGVAVCLASQNVTHFPKDIDQLISTKMCFRMSKREAREFFEMFNNTVTGRELDIEESIQLTTRLETGHCFMIDPFERCALIHITSNYDQGDITSNPLFKKDNEDVYDKKLNVNIKS